MSNNLNDDINNTITSAVNSRVEAAVLEAMSSQDVMRGFVTAALSEPVKGNRYDEKTTLLNQLVQTSIKEQAKAVVAEEVARLEDTIREQVREAVGKSVGVISDSLVDGFVENARGRYPSIKVEFNGE